MDSTGEQPTSFKIAMTAPQFFGALVRAIGLYWLTYGLTRIVSACAPAEGYTYVTYIILASAYMVIGAFLMLKADPIVEMCYAKTDSDGYPESKDPS
jgi:hypothetical protein